MLSKRIAPKHKQMRETEQTQTYKYVYVHHKRLLTVNVTSVNNAFYLWEMKRQIR